MNENVIVFKNVKLKWAFLAQPYTEGDYASGKYQVSVIISEADKKRIESLHLSSKQKIRETEEGFEITLKSKRKPKVLNAFKQKMSDDEVQKIGNGSEGHISARTFEARGQKFIGLCQVMVTDLQEYEGEDGDTFADIEPEEAPFDTDEDLS